jgi:hypothetical protein
MDWLRFLEGHRISYVSRGSNTKKGEVSVQCPFCGDDDPSEHLGISLSSANWGCLRNAQHRGHKPFHLVAALLGCSMAQARLAVAQFSAPDVDGLDDALQALEAVSAAPEPAQPRVTKMQHIDEFRHITGEGSSRKHWKYLYQRGFDSPSALADEYGLMYCTTGQWKDRIIIPVLVNGEMIAWTARALGNPKNAPRYLSSSNAVKETIFNEDEVRKGGNLLFVTEGPFDALKLDYYGKPFKARATCIFGLTLSIDQVTLLKLARPHYRQVILLFDENTLEQSFYAQDWLQPNVTIGHLPKGVKDPGSMRVDQVVTFIKQCEKPVINQGWRNKS